MKLRVNDQETEFEAPPDMPLLWVLRDELGLTGTKFGCGVASCGACTVEVDGVAMRSCVVPASALAGRSVRTIEAPPDRIVAALQAAWVRHQTPQCGYCQGGTGEQEAAAVQREAHALAPRSVWAASWMAARMRG